MSKVENLIEALFDVGAVKFGSFTLKSGIQSPIYFDLRVIISHPKLMQAISEIVEDVLCKYGQVDVLCGVPYTALPIATIVSVQRNIPMIIKRKEQKKYGTGKLIEGEYEVGKTKCLILEDVVTTGSSIVETTEALQNHGILVDSAIVVLNRNYPAADENLKKNGISLESLIKVDTLLQVLLNSSRITLQQKIEVEKFLADGQAPPSTKLEDALHDTVKSNGQAKHLEVMHSLLPANRLRRHAKHLFDIIISKQSNLCLSADCKGWKEVLQVTEAIANKICAVKTHVDAIDFANSEEINEFKQKIVGLSKRHNFIIIEDRKFADIGSTVEKQLNAKPFEISEWADFLTVHSISGPGMLKVFKEQNKGVILIAEMSSVGNLPSVLAEYKDKTLGMCEGYEESVVGFVSQSRVGKNSLNSAEEQQGVGPYYLQFTPGVSLESSGDSLGQQYVNVKDAVLKRDADVIIVGRGIIQQDASKWENVAELYRKEGWEALQKKFNLA